jgi:CRP-like cAMP-binding protein
MSELNIVERVIALEAVDLFRNLMADQLSRIAMIAREERYQPGQEILAAGAAADSVMVIVDGEADLIRGGEAFHQASRGQVLGAWALFDSAPMELTAQAAGDVRLLRVSRSDFFDLLGDNMEITAAIFSTLVKRFRQLAGH